MTGLLQRLRMPFAGSGRGVTVPPMDGALKPNQALEHAPVELQDDRPDNLAQDGGRLLFTSGALLKAIDIGKPDRTATILEQFASEITAVACDGAGGYAVGLDHGEIVFGGALWRLAPIRQERTRGPTALAFDERGRLFMCTGSASNRPSEWKRDLMQRNESGSVWRFDLPSGMATCLADGLAFANGVAVVRGGDELLISESWKHRLLLLQGIGGSGQAKMRVVLDDLPGYPARLSAGASGYWLSVFAPRSQLIEFVLREDAYRRRMVDTIDSRFWMAPALSSGRDFEEPMQLGSIRTMGTLKPWAPTRSYGLLVHLDDRYQPTGSAHSRSDGTRHGITSSIEWHGRVLAASKGGNVVVSLDVTHCAED